MKQNILINIMRNLKKKINRINISILIYITLIILIPFILNSFFLKLNIVSADGLNNSQWLSFWGSYLGAVISGTATLIAVLVTISFYEKQDKEKMNEKYNPVFIIFIVKDRKYQNNSLCDLDGYYTGYIRNSSEYDLYDVDIFCDKTIWNFHIIEGRTEQKFQGNFSGKCLKTKLRFECRNTIGKKFVYRLNLDDEKLMANNKDESVRIYFKPEIIDVSDCHFI